LFITVKCLLGDLLKKADLSQIRFSELTGIPKSQISEYVNDKHVMSLETAKIISHVLKCPIEDLYVWEMVAGAQDR
jgi:transcriptional regulator with XRE-family HTH domain